MLSVPGPYFFFVLRIAKRRLFDFTGTNALGSRVAVGRDPPQNEWGLCNQRFALRGDIGIQVESDAI